MGNNPFAKDAPHNPFQAPRSRVADPTPSHSGVLLKTPKRNAAGRGWSWLSEGWGLFKEAPGTWVGISVAMLVLGIVINLIPLVNLLSTPLFTVASGGLMLGCRSLEQGQGLAFGHLFEGFKRHAGKLLAVGFLYLLASAVIGIAVFAVVLGGSGALDFFTGNPPETVDPLGLILAALVMMALLIPAMMSVWFASPLIVFHDLGALQAMGLSFRGCLRNLMPFLVYGIAGLVLTILAILPVGLGWLILAPVLIGSIYKGYQDIFVA
jgi:uncharacterized membrane protein